MHWTAQREQVRDVHETWVCQPRARFLGIALKRPAQGWLLPAIIALLLLLGGRGVNTARAQAVKGEIVSVGIGGANGGNGVYRTGSWVPVQVKLQNMTPGPIVGHLGIQSNDLNDLDGDRVTSIGPEFTLNAGTEERTFWTYYWPGPDDQSLTGTKGITSVIVLGKDRKTILAEVTTPDRNAGGIGLGRSDDGRDATDRSLRFVVVLGKSFAGWNSFLRSWGGTETIAIAQVKNPTQLPDDVKGFDAVDTIVWEADTVKPSEVPPEFQLKAMLEWVKAGGHLIISVGSQWQEFLKADPTLQAALPMTMKESRPAKWSDIRLITPGWSSWVRNDDALSGKTFEQVTGDLKPAARAVVWPTSESFAKAPLVVTGLYGQGAVTLVTFDVTNADLADAFKDRDKDWAQFWTDTAGWMWADDFKPAVEYEKDKRNGGVLIATSPGTLKFGESLPQEVDVKEQTAVRIIVAILFLAIYWLLAGPVGHLILRTYRVVHWSWWIFGGTVLLAMGVAGAVVVMLHITTSEVRHKSYVLGRVNSREVTVNSFYGVYAPASGAVELSQPKSDGMNYLVPMCFPTNGDVKAYADPQGYELWTDQATAVSPIFRNTLKKMQGRWSGEMAGITGTAEFTPNTLHVLKGSLTNESDYELANVDIVVYKPVGPNAKYFPSEPGGCYLYQLNEPWKKGTTIDLEKAITLNTLGAKIWDKNDVGDTQYEAQFASRFGQLLEVIPRARASKTPYGSVIRFFNDGEKDMARSLTLANTKDPILDDDMALLLDTRAMDSLDVSERVEVVRGMGRLIDCTKELHAAGALIIAHTTADTFKAPVPLAMNGSVLPSKGGVVFAWALPVTGEPPASMLPPKPAQTAPEKAGDVLKGIENN